MSDDDMAVSFVVEYELSLDDLREGAIVGRSAARRAKSLVSQLTWPVLSLAAVQGRYRFEVAADGLTTASPNGTIAYIPWPVFTPVRETRERFFLFERRYKEMWVLPKRALGDQSSVERLGELLQASAGRPIS